MSAVHLIGPDCAANFLHRVKQSARPTDILKALSSAHHADVASVIEPLSESHTVPAEDKYNQFPPYSIVAQFRALEHNDISDMQITAHKGNASRK